MIGGSGGAALGSRERSASSRVGASWGELSWMLNGMAFDKGGSDIWNKMLQYHNGCFLRGVRGEGSASGRARWCEEAWCGAGRRGVGGWMFVKDTAVDPSWAGLAYEGRVGEDRGDVETYRGAWLGPSSWRAALLQ